MASTRHIKSKILAQQTSCWLLSQEDEPPPPLQGAGVAVAVAANASTEMMAVYFIFEFIKAIAKIFWQWRLIVRRSLLGSLVPVAD
jgi:hypothetical protein